MIKKPPGLPALPLRTQFTLVVLAAALACPALMLILISMASAPGGVGWLHVLLAGLILYAAFALWRSAPRSRLRDTRVWWLTELTEEPKGFGLSWEPQVWRDLLPRRSPAAWAEPIRFPWVFITAFPLFGLIYAASNDAPLRFSKAVSDGAFFLALLWLILLINACITVPFTQKKRSRAWFTSESVSYFPAPVMIGKGGLFGIGNLEFMRILTRGVRFESDGVTILAPRLYGFVPVSFRVPTRDPAIRKRIEAWAETFGIPISNAPVE